MKSKIKKLLFIGDIVGNAGFEALKLYLPKITSKYDIDFIVVNGENRSMPQHAGLTSSDAYDILDLGVDVITLGNHVVLTPCISDAMANQAPIIRPMNIPNISGSGHIVIEKEELKFLVLNAICNNDMPANYDNVYAALESFMNSINVEEYNCVFLDIHGLYAMDKLIVAHYFNGLFTAIIGTHTHIPTEDCRIVGKGTAYRSDSGMTGNYSTMKGKFYDWCNINKAMYWNTFNRTSLTRMPQSYNTKSRTLCGTLIYFDPQNRKANAIKSIIYGDTLSGAIK